MGKARTFKLTADITAGKNSLLGFQLVVAEAAEGHTYQFTIDTEIISYTAAGGDGKEQIRDGLRNSLNTAYPQGAYTAGNKGEDGLVVHRSEGTAPFALSSSDTMLEFPLLGVYSRYECTVTGAVIVPMGALNEIVSRVNGLDSAVNYASGITGRAVESDAELRMGLGSRQKQATANEVAIQNEILKVSGVEYARVYSNRDITEVSGRPPKSYEAVVVGGDDQAIAELIFEKGPAGVQAYGNIVKDVIDSEGFHWNIGFSRPLNKYVWVKVDYSRNSEEDLPAGVVSAIQDNIIAWSHTALNVGVDLIYQKMFRPVYDVRGIGFAAIKVAVTTGLNPPGEDEYRSENVEISEVEIAVLDRTRIIVRELAA
jgi:uncharacterized phage protein gp47/JayE